MTVTPFPTVIILAGGLGTRIRGILGDCPKVLAPVHGRPFLDHLLHFLAAQGARRAVLCLGHLANQVTAHLAATRLPPGLTVDQVIEPAPLGTAGAVRLALARVEPGPVLIMNGDTWLDADLASFAREHQRSGATASLLCMRMPDTSRYGRVEVDDGLRVTRFVEKDPAANGPGLVSTGIVLLSAETVAALPGQSLERDVLQKLPPGAIRVEIAPGAFLDIGTPESLVQAERTIPPLDD